jgi:predicted ferric reductase
MEAIGYPALLIMGILPLLRRRSYEIFKYFHYWFLALIPASIIHAHNGWYFPLGGIAFWLVDCGIRIVSSSSPCRLVAAHVHDAEDGISELRFEKKFELPGMYCWINVPQISLLQWHPFSLSSSPFDSHASMHIKSMGADQFTGKLYSLIGMTKPGGTQITLNVDGPYGQPIELDGYAALLLIAGGIGITPMLSTFRYLKQLGCARALPAMLQKVRLIFVAKSYDLVQVFLHSLQDAIMETESQLELRATIYLTNHQEIHQASVDGWGEDVISGRPDLGALYDGLLGELNSNDGVLVKCCGPESLDASAKAAANLRPQITYESKAFVI